MNSYLVKLNLIIGEFEKIAYHVVTARNSKSAKKKAIENECHCGAEFTDKNYDEAWDAGQMVYRVYSVEKLNSADSETLNRLIR